MSKKKKLAAQKTVSQPALSAPGLPVSSYTDPSLSGSTIKKMRIWTSFVNGFSELVGASRSACAVILVRT